ncbi:Surfeit locus protein 1 [Arabidopsis thaliana]|uniref:Surfeit locus protein 1 n=4 Tax=Arabidopsis TaxID=3701 RepID=SURF1_ARATH|nr:Surfeit locus 1 cytochrome c oxidase biogenesis protein [Arabidopsis thaliana]Q9SE51.1 RecName: Full=Surfeit locus protein 1; Short=Surfeit 1; AltName: Full=Cytochrome c oxidase assembly protein SURF1; AltName: Full=Protein EMBRYO DEFECTIVE 3121; AltName: Full=Surfeit locus 1 cytochrome c oxidase biogenesis protein [Arabidopsis thaliana]KAG7625640.1 Surfeit locus 1/Shy1 [Arabidopsis thaliana x Arabidopsis arenosa]KAG7631647.1 Surfeit locus 1/Shy1 [Arabidopsis suecica]AAF19609.1 Surfeit 1 [Ar|eukprot:NP_566592.1 Surfeit locus 1 cytochrome c oxidase biogenesis protein [Arabidopsis thaliana]
MATSLSKILTRSNTKRYWCSTTTSISASPSLPKQFWSRHFSAVADSSSSSSAALGSQSSSSAPPQENKRGSKWSQLLLFLPGAITFGLGSWQIVRREEKFKTLEYQQQRLNMEPIKLNIDHPLDKNLNALEFRRVSCKGVFDEQRSIYLGPRSRSISGITENGFFVITPLMPIPGDLDSMQSPILVNRGWVPRSWREKSQESAEAEFIANQSTKAKSPSNEPKSWWKFWSKTPVITKEHISAVKPVEVVGVIRGGENPSIFVPSNDPSTGQWFYVDVPAMARAVGLPENTIYVEDVHEHVDRSRPYPVPKDINTLIRSKVMPQDHLNYSITWYSLSAAVTFMAYKRLKAKPVRR